MSEELEQNLTEGLLGGSNAMPDPEMSIPDEETQVDHLVDDSAEEAKAAETVLEKPEYLENKFWDPKGGVKIEEMNNSYKELQKQFSMGKHKAPKEYDLTAFDGVDIENDPLAKEFVDWANENKPTQQAFDKLIGKFKELADVQSEQSTINIDEETTKLGPNAPQIVNGIKQWGQGLVSKGVWSEDDFEEFKVFAATANGINALNKVRKYYGDAQIPTAPVDVDGMPSAAELYELVADPKYKTDSQFRRKVEEQFSRAFPGQSKPGEM